MHTFHANLFYLLIGMVIETEGHDRSDINLPGSQLQLLQDSANTATGELLVCNNNYHLFTIINTIKIAP